MPLSLTKLQDLRTALDRLNAERPAGLRAEAGLTPYQDRGEEFIRRLSLEVISRQGKARVLVTGQTGVGKSSELWRYFEENRRNRTGSAIFCDLEKQEHPEHCGATGVLLTIFRDCWGATQKIRTGRSWLARLRDDILARLIDWLKGRYTSDRSEVVFPFGGMDFHVHLKGREDRALAMILGKAAQHEAVSQPEERFGLVPDSLIHLLNDLLKWIVQQSRQGPPLLIVDHVDKIRDPSAAEDVLLKAVPQWTRIEASIVMTAPFEYTLGAFRDSVESRWGRPLIVYPVEMAELGKDPLPPIYERIASGAGLAPLLGRESLELLAHFSGGVLRFFVQFLIEACKEAYLAGHPQIEPSDAWTVVHRAERAYQDYGIKELALLDEISKTGTGLGLGDTATLLRSPIGLLIGEPVGGQQQIRIHPLVRTALERHQALKKESA